MSRVLTFDLGTTYFKVCVFDEEAGLVAQHRVAAPVEHPAPGRVELPVAAFCRELVAAVHEVAQRAGGLGDVDRVNFASQANSFTLVDKLWRPLIPFLLWSDERAIEPDGRLHELAATPDFYRTTGIAELNYQFLPAKIAWLHQHEPSVMSRTHRVCTLSDYLVWWLTGNHLAEASLAGLTGLADIHELRWWPRATELFEIPLEWLPPIERAGSDAGVLRPDRAQEFGVSPRSRCVMGCLDQYAGAIGADNVVPGRISETTGTVLAVVKRADSFSANAPAGVYQGPASKAGDYYQMTFSSVSAGLLERYRNELPDRPAFSELDRLADQIPAGAEGLQLNPSAAQQDVSQMFLGRTGAHGRGHEVRAIMEGVAFELRSQVHTLCGGNWPTSIRAAGGAAQSNVWLQIKSQILGCPVEPVPCPEPTNLGVARLCFSRTEN